MKILMTADSVGGVWQYSLELMRALPECEFVLATMGAPLSDSQAREVSQLANVEIHSSSFALEWMENPWQDVEAAATWLLQLARDFAPDIVHLNSYAHGALDWPAPVVVVGHSCVLSWFEAVENRDAPASWNRYREEVMRGLRAADVVVAPTRAMLGELEKFYGPFARTAVIFNARDAAIYTPVAKENYVLAAGRLWDEAKNIGALARVSPRLSWPVCVAGNNQHPDGGEISLQNVRALGQLNAEAMRDALGRAAIYALPARYEPFGLSILEAGLSGCALVLGDIASLREVWGDAAIFVAPDDENALQSAIAALIDDENLRAEMGARALVRARGFSPGAMAHGYREIYRSLVECDIKSQPA